MALSAEDLEITGESADCSISPYVWRSALVDAARQNAELHNRLEQSRNRPIDDLIAAAKAMDISSDVRVALDNLIEVMERNGM